MNSSVLQTQLQVFAQQLQHELAEIPQYSSLGVRSAVKQDMLMILVQHPPEVALDPSQTFSVLEKVLQQQQLDWLKDWFGEAQRFTIRLYLRVLGQTQSYDFCQFTLEPLATVSEGVVSHSLEKSSDIFGSSFSKSTDAESTDSNTAIATTSEASAIEDSALEELLSLDPVETDLSLLTPQSSQPGTPLLKILRIPQHLLPATVLSAAVGLFILVGGIFALTRPCVLGRCLPLETAQKLSTQSMQMIQSTRSADDVLTAYDHLLEASYLLGTIPPWSSYHRSAQDLLVNFETDTTALERVVSALEKGSEAAQKSQNPPHPLPEWQSVKKLWEQAIALLQGVPQSSPVYPLAQRKLKEYQHNLAATNQRLTIEQKAQQEVVKARSTAELASTRENIAVSLTDWQLAYATWQTVVYQLQKVPKTTMAYAEAQQLLEIYQTKLVKVGDRHTQEEIAQNAYNQAIALADQAHRSEQNDQWTQAVDAWQEALTHIQQIPQGSSYYQQVQTLTVSYRTSLTTAQEHLRVAVAVQLVENDLNSACSGMTPICRYMLAGNIVRISVTSDYEQAVKQIMFYAQPEAGTSFEVIARSNFLLRAIANISETAQLPIEFYDSNGAIMGKYDPQLSGYVRQ